MEGGPGGGGILDMLKPLVIPLISGGVKMLVDHFMKNDEENEDNIKNELENQLNELKSQKKYYEELNQRSEARIQNLENKLKENLDELKRREIEREKELLEKEQKEKQKQIEEIMLKQEAIKNCKKSLNKAYSKGIFKIIRNFAKEEKKWLDSLDQPEIKNKITNLTQKLEILFDELYEHEKILEKLNQKFIITLQKNYSPRELNKLNYIIIGTSGVGKSTLINELFGEKLAEEGVGTRITLKNTKYESKLVPFMSLLDTMGTEIGSGHRLIDVLDETLDYITKQLNSNDPNDHIHCILYCTSSNRVFKDELDVVLKLRAKYDGKKLPIVIVYTRATNEEEVEASKDAINNFLQEHGESLSDDIFGITFIKVNAREKITKKLETTMDPCFGLSNLMTTCFNKGKKSYLYAIKNSLIQIGTNTIKEYINDICNQLSNNLNYFFYLNQNFEPNFSNYISYCFEKITDVENQEGINNDEMEELQSYINGKKLEQKKKEDITQNLCMSCQKETPGPYKCSFCQTLSCEKCFYSQFQLKDTPRCLLCDQELVENPEAKELKENNINEEDNNNIIFSTINYMNILRNKLNIESRNCVHNYIEEFKNELIDIVNEKFENFSKDASKKLYTKVLEQYRDNMNNNVNNADLKESMKSKAEIKSETNQKLNEVLKEKAIDNFLKKNAAELYQKIIEIFKNKLLQKLDEFILNIDQNKEVNKFFDSCDELNEDKKLKIENDIDNYIKSLQDREAKSDAKSIQLQYGGGCSQGDSCQGESSEQCGESSNKYGESSINNSSSGI